MSKIRVRHGDNEIELEGSYDFIKKHLDDFYTRLKGKISKPSVPIFAEEFREIPSKKIEGKIPTPAEFYKSKEKKDGISTVLIIAKYLEEYRDTTEFSPKDINKVVREEIKLSRDISTVYFSRAVKQGLLRSLGYGKYTLTLSAEEALSAM